MSEDNPQAWGYGIATIDTATKTVLDTWFKAPQMGPPPAGFDPHLIPTDFSRYEGTDDLRGVHTMGVTTVINVQEPPQSTSDVYLRLHLLSHCLATPGSVNVEGIFGLLPVVAFTNRGPIHPDFMTANRPELQSAGAVVSSMDRFPPLLNYHTPPRVRIADASRVRL